MKPNLKICKECKQYTYRSAASYWLPSENHIKHHNHFCVETTMTVNGGSVMFGASYLPLAEELPKNCKYTLEHAVSQENPQESSE